MKFYQDNTRDQSQPFSNDTFKLSLNEVVLGCVPDIEKYRTYFRGSEQFLEYAGVSPVYENAPFDYSPLSSREIVDYLIDLTIASHILYTLFFTTTDEELKNVIDKRIDQLNDSIGPRTGVRVEVYD